MPHFEAGDVYDAGGSPILDVFCLLQLAEIAQKQPLEDGRVRL
jgi:hypothetical protein